MFTVPELPYAYEALEPYIDTETMHLHHDKHHAAYVNGLNEALTGHEDWMNKSVEDILKHLDKVPEGIRTKVRNMGGGHANHSLYWAVMGPPADGAKPMGKIATAIETTFGSFSAFQDLFSKTALGRFGSGWAWLVAQDGKLSVMDTVNQDSPLSQGKTPILALDVWEHAYYLKYKNKRGDYITNWWNVVNWKAVDERFASAV